MTTLVSGQLMGLDNPGPEVGVGAAELVLLTRPRPLQWPAMARPQSFQSGRTRYLPVRRAVRVAVNLI